jgi:hypothetical protein
MLALELQVLKNIDTESFMRIELVAKLIVNNNNGKVNNNCIQVM